MVEPHRHEGIFVARGKEDALVTLNSTPGIAVYGEKRISVEVPPVNGETVGHKVEYRVWNPFRSKRTFVLYIVYCCFSLNAMECVTYITYALTLSVFHSSVFSDTSAFYLTNS